MAKTVDGKVKAVDKRGRTVWIPPHWLTQKSFGFRTPPSQKKTKRAASANETPKPAEAAAEAKDSKEE